MNLEELLKSLGLDDEAIGKVVEATKPEQSQVEEIERLRKHNETLLGEKKAESEKRKAEQAEKDRLAEETARKKGDFEALEKQYQADLIAFGRVI